MVVQEMPISTHWYLLPEDPLLELILGISLLGYVYAVVIGTKFLYARMIERGVKHNVAVYYNRKIIHVLAGGVIAILTPFVFSSPLIPFSLAMVLAISIWIPHYRGKLMLWFQVEENMFEVNFCVMWGVSILATWLLLGDPLYALVPITFMAFGDAATGFMRNMLFQRRTKSWWGNLAMAIVTIPIGTWVFGAAGAGIAALCSLIEHYEFGMLDDNITVPLAALMILLILNPVPNI